MRKKKTFPIQPYNADTAMNADLLVSSLKSLLRNVIAEEIGSLQGGGGSGGVGNSAVAQLTLSDDALIGEDLMIAYRIVQAICAKLIDPKRVSMRDNQAYKAIVLDNNNRKTVVRLVFGKVLKQVHLIHTDKNVVKKKVKLDDLTSIYDCTKDIEARIRELSQIK
jgi:hypothetical protein